MSALFFTADTHFYHSRIIRFCNRPFQTQGEMNEYMIKQWNSVVDVTDHIYHLGDFALARSVDTEEILIRLNGHKHLCIGSHESSALAKKYMFEEIADNFMITELIGDIHQKIFMSHYCHKTWPLSHYNSFQLFGHSHGRLDKYAMSEGKLLDIGVDSHGFKPWSLEEVVKEMGKHPDNFNLVSRYMTEEED